RAGTADKTLRLYDGLVHDLLREPDGGGARVAGDVVAWFDAHTGGAPVTFTSSELTAPLAGDPSGHAMTIDLDLRGELPRDRATGDVGATAGLRLRAGIGRATALGLGYAGGLDLRGGVEGGGGAFELDAH